MKKNKLSVNINKTNYVIFSSKQKTTKVNLPVLFDDKPLKRVNVVKFLGIYIDENLTWKYQIDPVCNKISKSIGVIARSRFVLSTKAKLSLYYSLIYPYINYCNVICSASHDKFRLLCSFCSSIRAIKIIRYFQGEHSSDC